MWEKPGKMFFRYVVPSILGMVGMSAYVLADTFFISVAGGADGIATLNLVLPVYGLIFAIGSMIGSGAATRYALRAVRDEEEEDTYFTNSILWAIMTGILFLMIGILSPETVLKLMGADDTIIQIGIPYLRIVLFFAPFFMLNYIINAFTRNDGAPGIAMIATLSSSIFNIIFDYILMFPLGMGMTGAALATAFSPVVGSGICMIHVLSKKSHLKFRWSVPSVKLLIHSCQLGVPAFIGEFASGVTTFVFNILILRIAGNSGVAAFGVVANISLVVIAIFNGISQGGQPLYSYYFGRNETKNEKIVLKYALVFAIVVATLIIGITNAVPDRIADIFNSEGNLQMQELAVTGIRIYFTGSLFAGVNIVVAGYFGAIGNHIWSAVISVLRGIIVIIVVAVILARVGGMIGIWTAFSVTECMVMMLVLWVLRKK